MEMNSSDPGRRTSEFPLARFLLALGGFAALALLVIRLLPSGGPFGGGIYLESGMGDEELEFYIGEHWVGRGTVFLSWDRLMGAGPEEPLSILPGDEVPQFPLPSQNPDLSKLEAIMTNHLTRIAGEGAELVHFEWGNPPLASMQGRHVLARMELLLRRADGQLDQVFCLDASLASLSDERHRVLVPIRVKRVNQREVDYFTSDKSTSANIGRFDNFRDRVTLAWSFERADGPESFLKEIESNGLWKPATNSQEPIADSR